MANRVWPGRSLGAEDALLKGRLGNQYPDSLVPPPSPGQRLSRAGAPGTPGTRHPGCWQGRRSEESGSGGGRQKIRALPASAGYNLDWASSELQKVFFFPPSVSSALCYKENILNRNLNGFCQDF